MKHKILTIIVMLAVMVAMTEIAAAEYDPWGSNDTIPDPTLWLYLEGSEYTPGTSSENTWVNEGWYKVVNYEHGQTYTDYVDVIAHHRINYAKDVNFYAWVNNPSLIDSFTIGNAQLYLDGAYSTTRVSSKSVPTFTFTDSRLNTGNPLDLDPSTHQGQPGYYLRTNIGNVPRVPNFNFGDPDLSTIIENPDEPSGYSPGETKLPWDPSKLNSYVRVPITYTITSDTSKDLSGLALVIHFDAHNHELSGCDKKHQSQTANSHDSVIIPEFATIAIPIAAVLGLVFFFQNKKNKQE